MMLLYGKNGCSPCASVSVGGDQEKRIVHMNQEGDAWILLTAAEDGILAKMRQYGTPLKDMDVRINYGIKTGCNEAFIIDRAKYDELVAADPKSAEVLKPLLRGRDIRRYGHAWAQKYLIGTHNGMKAQNIPPVHIEDYPAVKAHLDQYWNSIEKRDDQGDTPYNLRNCAYWQDFEKPKIVWAETMRKHKTGSAGFPRFGYVDIPFYSDKTCFILIGIYLKFLLAILNSKAMRFFIHYTVAHLDTGGFNMQKIYVDNFPIPQADRDVYEELMSLVENTLNARKHNKDTAELESKIDRIVYGLYHLTEDEIALVEEKKKREI